MLSIRRALQVLALVGTLLVGTLALVLIVSQTPWFRDWLRRYVVRESKQYLERRAVDRRPDRQSALRDRADGRRGRCLRPACRGGQGAAGRLQRVPDPLQRDRHRRHQARLPEHRRSSATQRLEPRPAGEEAGRGSGSQGPGPADFAAVDRAHRRHGDDRRQGRRPRPTGCRRTSTACTSKAGSSTRRCTTRSRWTTCGSAVPRRT